jgi:hypothetical protein
LKQVVGFGRRLHSPVRVPDPELRCVVPPGRLVRHHTLR